MKPRQQITIHGDNPPVVEPQSDVASDPSKKNKSKEAEEDIDFADINPFSFRRPKNAAAGLSSGLKNVGKGVLGGAAAMLYAPCTSIYFN